MKYLLSLMLLVLTNSLMAKELYVKTGTAKIYEHPSKKSSIINIISHGQKVTDLKVKKKKYLKVEYKNTIGWMSKYQLSKRKIKNKKKSLFVSTKDISNDARESKSAFTSTASARGFRSDTSGGKEKQIIYFNKEEKKYLKAYEDLVYLISRQASDYEIGELK